MATSPAPRRGCRTTTRRRWPPRRSGSASSDGRPRWRRSGTRWRRVAERVVMLVRNAYTHDTRVEKEARTLTKAGYDVTVVADAAPGQPERETRDGSAVLRVS